MGPDSVVAGSTNVSVVIRIMDSTDGTPETGVEHNTSGIDLWYRRETAVSTDITEAALAALTTAHTDGGIEHINDGYYRLDVPDAAFATGVDGVQIGGTVTGMVVYGPYIRLTDPVNELFTTTTLGATGNTTTALHLASYTTFADDELNDELWWIYDVSEAEWHPFWITDFANTGALATVISARGGGALPFTPQASTDLVWRSGATRSGLFQTASTLSLPGQEAPPLAPTPEQALTWLYKVLRNRTAQTATQWSLYADDETTVDAKATVSDDTTTAIVQEIVTGP